MEALTEEKFKDFLQAVHDKDLKIQLFLETKDGISCVHFSLDQFKQFLATIHYNEEAISHFFSIANLKDQNIIILTEDQLTQIIDTYRKRKHESLSSYNIFFDGNGDPEDILMFLDKIYVIMNVEKVTDRDAFLTHIAAFLKGSAETWWQQSKDKITKWSDFECSLRTTFAPAHIVYESIGRKQKPDEHADIFVMRKKLLFSLLPESEHEESQKLDMVFGLFHPRIRNRFERESFSSLDELIGAAQKIDKEYLFKTYPKRRVRCKFCRSRWHSKQVCMKKKKRLSKQKAVKESKMYKSVYTQAPSPNAPVFSCYGCGAPNVFRSQCPKCIITMEEEAEARSHIPVAFY